MTCIMKENIYKITVTENMTARERKGGVTNVLITDYNSISNGGGNLLSMNSNMNIILQ